METQQEVVGQQQGESDQPLNTEPTSPTNPAQTTLAAQFAALSQVLGSSNGQFPSAIPAPEVPPSNDVFVEHIEVPNGSMRHVVVKHLPSYYSKEMLYTLFVRFGPIAHCKLIVDKSTGESLGYAFVEYQNEEHALASVKALNGYLPQGSSRPLKVHLAAPGPASRKSLDQDKTNLFIGGLPLDMKLADLNALFSRFGPILESRILPNKFIDDQGKEKAVGFVRFAEHSQALNAIETMNNAVLRDQTNEGATYKLMCKFSHDSKKQVHSAIPPHTISPLLGNFAAAQQLQQQKLLQQLQLAQLQMGNNPGLNNVPLNNLGLLQTLAALQASKPALGLNVNPYADSISPRSFPSPSSSLNMSAENSLSHSSSSYSHEGDMSAPFSRFELDDRADRFRQNPGVDNGNYFITPGANRFSGIDGVNSTPLNPMNQLGNNAQLMALLTNNPLTNPLASNALSNPLLNPLLVNNPSLLNSMINQNPQALNLNLSALLAQNPLFNQFQH